MAKKVPIVVNRKKKGSPILGVTDFNDKNRPTKVTINLQGHFRNGELNKKDLASTVKHEMLHVKHPSMTEKQVYKHSAQKTIAPREQSRLLAMVEKDTRDKKINYKVGAAKRKYKMEDDPQPGDLIRKMNESKITNNLSKEQLAIRGMV